MKEPIVIYIPKGMMRVFGEVSIFGKDSRYRIDLVNPLEHLDGDKRYRVEIMSKRVVFMGWLSIDKTYIIQD